MVESVARASDNWPEGSSQWSRSDLSGLLSSLGGSALLGHRRIEVCSHPSFPILMKMRIGYDVIDLHVDLQRQTSCGCE